MGLKLRYRPFITVSRSLTLAEPSNDPELLADAAVSLLDRVEKERAGAAARRPAGDGAAGGRLLISRRGEPRLHREDDQLGPIAGVQYHSLGGGQATALLLGYLLLTPVLAAWLIQRRDVA